MRRIAVLVLLAGCGRLQFDPRNGGDDGGNAGDGDGDVDGMPGDARSDAPGDGVQQTGNIYLISSDGVSASELFTVQLATGQLTLVTTIPAGFGMLGGLAYWDANTFYASTQNSIVRITLSPPAVAQSRSIGGTWSAIERDGQTNALYGVDQDGDSTATFDPEGSGTFPSMPIGFDVLGGDVVNVAGTWFWWSSNQSQLYTLPDVTPIGSPQAVPFMSGMTKDAFGDLWLHSGDSNNLYPLNRTTGVVGAPIALCVSCPTTYDVKSGDMTRTP